MSLSILATYENGVLKPEQPLPLPEHTQVRVTIEPTKNWVDATAGMLGWQGTTEELQFFALDPELDAEESA
jgi:predicted DNA-binding antitoxin AbrB/MazE fold protein